MRGSYWFNRDKSQPDSPSLDKLVGGANEVAVTARNLLTAMLALAVTMAATMIAATDEALLRDSAEVFPSLGVKIRLSTAYLLAPMIFAFLHANALLQLHLLGRRLHGMEGEMERRKLAEPERVRWRRTVHGFAFAQMLLGRDSHRSEGWAEWLHRIMLGVMSWLAIAGIPLTLLVTAQVSFVRYQSDAITLAHQVTLSFDLAMLLGFNLSVLKWGVASRRLAWSWYMVRGFCAGALLALSWTQAVPPTPDQRDNLLEREGLVPDSGWTRRSLDLSNHTLINLDAKPNLLESFAKDGDDKAAMQRQMTVLDLHGRSLRFADFRNAMLFGADLRGIKAEESIWDGARLRGARFDFAQLEGASLGAAHLEGADLRVASLEGADLRAAHLEGAHLGDALLKGADLREAHLEGADLRVAHLEGASLESAHLEGADLREAHLEGARLGDAHLEGAHLRAAHLEGAVFDRAQLEYSTGAVGSCDGTLVIPASPALGSVDAVLETLKTAGLSGPRIAAVKARIALGRKASCGGVALDRLPLASPDAFAKAQMAVACSNVNAARTIFGGANGVPDQHRRAFTEARDAATCPAVVAARQAEWPPSP